MDSAYDDLFLDNYIMTPSSPPPAREQLGLDLSPAKLPHEMQREEDEVRKRSFFGKQGIMKRVNKFQSLLGATVSSRTSRQEDHRAPGPSHVRFKGVTSPRDSRSGSASMSISGSTAPSGDTGIAQDMSEHSEHTYDDISIIPLEELLKDEFVDTDLEVARKDPRFHTQVREAFRSALQCVYSPFYAQLEKNLAMDDASFVRSEENIDHGNGDDGSDSTAIDELEDDDLGTPISSSALTSSSEPAFNAGLVNPSDFQWKLVRTLRHAFRGLVTESEFRSDWTQFVSESSFDTQYPCDLTLRTLEQRKNSIPHHPYFRKEQFATEEQYETWMHDEINTVDKLIETALEVRKHKVNMAMRVDLRNVAFFRGIRKVNTELRLRCGGNWAGDWVKCTEYDPDTECYIFDWDSRPGFDREYRERIGRERVEFVHKKNILGKSLVAGYFDVNIHSILKSLQSPLPRNWSQGVFEKKVEIKNAKGQAVGEADVSVLLKFHFFPSTSSRRTAAKQSEQFAPDYHRLYEILVSRIVKMHRINETTSERTILNFYERFILEEFALIYGIHEVFRRITSLKALAPRLDLITPFSDEIMRDIQFIHIAIEMDSFIVTLDDRQQLKLVIHTLDEKIFNLICDFKKYFPRNRPKGAFSTFFEIWWMIRTRYEGQSVDDERGTLAILCRDMVRKAIVADYDSIVDAVSTFDNTVHSGVSILDKDSVSSGRRKSITSGIAKHFKADGSRVLAGSVLSQVCRVLEGRINDTFNFSGIFPEEVKYEMISVKRYYELLRGDVELFLASKGGPNNLPPFDVLQIWSDMSRLHKTIIFNFEDVGELDFDFINLDNIAREQVPRWMAEMREKLLLYKTESIALDKYDEKSGLLHSTSVVDLFSAGNQMLEFIRGLDFVTLDILQSFVQVICDVTIEYARAMEDRCLLQLTERRAVVSSASQSRTDDITTEVVIDFASLREGVLKESDNFALELPPLLVTRDFIIKLNNIEAARQQLNHIIEAVENSKNEYFDTETEDYDDLTDDTATTISDFDDTSHSTTTTTVQPSREASEHNKKSTFRALNNMLDEVVVIMATQFQPFAHACLTDLTALAAGHKDLTEQQVQQDFQEKIDQVLESHLLDPVLTPSFIALNEHMYFDLFLRVLKRIYGTTLREIESLILPTRDFINRQKVQYLTIPQVYVLKSSLVPLFIFFRGGESDRGLSKEWLKDETRWVAQIMKIFDRPTERLISFYKKRFLDNEQRVENTEEEKQDDSEATVTSQQQQQEPQLQLQLPEKRLPNVRDIIEEEERNEEIEAIKRIEERRRMHSFTSVASVDSSVSASVRTSDKKKSYIDRITPIEIFLIIAARASYDKMAAKFVSEYKDTIAGLTLHEHLGLDPSQIVFETFHCFNHRMTPGRVIITSVYLLFQRLKMTGTGYSTKKQNMIRLMDVDDVKRSTSLMGKGFTIRATPATGADRQSYSLKLYFSRNATREKFYKTLAEHARAAGNKLFEGRQTAENLRIEPATETSLDAMAEIPSTTRRSLDRVAMEDEVRHSFGVDRSEILIDRFKCALKDQPGFLFIFTQCMCFRGTLDTSIKLTIPFSEVLRIEKSSLSHLDISLSSGITFEFKKFANRHHAYGVIFSQWDSFIERSSVSSYAPSSVFSANGTGGGPKSYSSGLSTASTSNLFKQRRKSIVGKIMSSTRRKSLPVGSAQRPSVSDEDQDHFYKTFDSIEPDELLIAKYERISYGSATGQLGTLYVSTRHICFEPAVMSSDKWVSISVSDIKEVVVKRSRMLVGKTMKLRLRNGGKVKFHIRSTSNDAIDLVKRLTPPFQASYV